MSHTGSSRPDGNNGKEDAAWTRDHVSAEGAHALDRDGCIIPPLAKTSRAVEVRHRRPLPTLHPLAICTSQFPAVGGNTECQPNGRRSRLWRSCTLMGEEA